MAERNLYLHEVIDIVGEGAMRYMEHTVGFNADAAADRGLELLGTWYTMGSTGRWPQVVNMWECVDGWSGWRRLMEATNLRRTTNPELNEWWQEALKSRSAADWAPRVRNCSSTSFTSALKAVARGSSMTSTDSTPPSLVKARSDDGSAEGGSPLNSTLTAVAAQAAWAVRVTCARSG